MYSETNDTSYFTAPLSPQPCVWEFQIIPPWVWAPSPTSLRHPTPSAGLCHQSPPRELWPRRGLGSSWTEFGWDKCHTFHVTTIRGPPAMNYCFSSCRLGYRLLSLKNVRITAQLSLSLRCYTRILEGMCRHWGLVSYRWFQCGYF